MDMHEFPPFFSAFSFMDDWLNRMIDIDNDLGHVCVLSIDFDFIFLDETKTQETLFVGNFHREWFP